jgi:dihydrofolate reductase
MINIIAAIGKRRELGKDNRLLWHLPQDLARFKRLTLDQVVIMGRKTYESIGKPLPNRLNIVITHRKDYYANGCWIVAKLDQALALAQEKAPNKEIFLIGGGQLYQQGIAYAQKLYLTLVDGEFEADTFFPDYSAFKKIVAQEEGEDNGYHYKFIELER